MLTKPIIISCSVGEQEAVEKLMAYTGLNENQVFIQALRLYQKVMLGNCSITENNPLPKMKEFKNDN